MAGHMDPATAGGPVASAPGTTGLGGTAGASASGQDVVAFVSQIPGTPVHFPAFHGRTVSWVAVSIIMAAFVVGGLALVFGPTWWLFWTALGVAAVGGLLALATGIFDDWY
jgi:hypothetical protein